MESPKLEDILTSAQQSLQEEQWAEAHRLFQEAIAQAPDNRDAQDGMRRIGEILVGALNEAAQAENDGQWAQARRFYQQALDISPGNASAQDSLNRVNHREQIDPQIQEMIQHGHEHFEASRYRAAYDAYVDALNLGGEKGILRYHHQLDSRRTQARDLAAWQERTRETLEQVERYEKQTNWSTALHSLDDLLQEMPTGPLYDQIAEPLRQEQQTIEDMVGDEVLYDEAGEAHNAKDYKLFVRRASRISSNSPHYQSVQNRIKQIEWLLEDQIRPTLRLAEEACEKEKWGNAFAHLDKLREKHDESPVWHPLWQRAGLGQGQQSLDSGRQANSGAKFDLARRHFEEARQAFEKVLDIYPTHPTARDLREEAAALTRIAASEKQAQTLWKEEQREQAQAALEEVRQRIKQARSEGREYPVVAAVVDTMYRTISNEIERIKEERIRLKDGERLLGEKRLSEAAECFHQALDALLPEDQRQAADGLGRVEDEIRNFKTEMEQGEKAADDFDAVDAYRAAHERWPSGPGMLRALEAALVKAGRAAREAGQDNRALEYLDQVLDREGGLNPDNKTAQQEWILIKEGPHIELELGKIVDEMDRLKRRENVSVTDVQALQDRLETLYREASSHPDLKERVEGPLDRVVKLRKLWQTFERQFRRANEAQTAGRWAEAVELLSKALAGLGKEVPETLTLKLGDWQAVVDAIQAAEETGQEARQEAQGGYERSPDSGDFNAPLEALDRGDGAFDRLTTAVAAAQGPWPKELTSLRKEVSDLRRRIELARDAWRAPAAADGLLIAQQALETWGGDPTLQAIEQALTKRAAEEIDKLIQRADTAREAGDLSAAVELLRQADQLRPGDADISAKYIVVQRHRRLEEKVKEAEYDADARLGGGSVGEAQETLEKTLKELLDPDAGLPLEARDILEALIRLAGQEDGLAFGLRDYWPQAQEMLEQLGRMSTRSREVALASRLADRWARATRDHSLPEVVESRIKLRQYLIAYRAAEDYMAGRASDERATQQLATATEALTNQVSESTDKRLKRAKSAKNNGHFQIALDNLKKLDEFYKEVEAEFPGLLGGYTEIEEMHQEAEELQQETERLEKEYAEALPILEEAEQAFQQNRLDDAEDKLNDLPRLETKSQLAEDAQELRERIEAARQKLVAQQLGTAITLARSALRQAKTLQDLEQIQKDLDNLAKETNILRLPFEEREAYDQVVAQVSQEIETLEASEAKEKEADRYIQEEGNYIEAANELEKAIKATREETKRGALQTRLNKIKPLAERQRQREEALARGRDYFRSEPEKRYREARQELSKAVDLGDESDEVNDLIRACRAGIMWQRARELMEEQEKEQEPSRKLDKLQDAQDEIASTPPLVKDNPKAEEIAGRINTLGKKIARRIKNIEKDLERLEEEARLEAERVEEENKRREERQEQERLERKERQERETAERKAREQAVQAAIREARKALGDGDVGAAQHTIEKALEQAPGHEEAQQLYDDTLNADLAWKTIGEAKTAMGEGNYDEALARVKAVLSELPPDNPNIQFYRMETESLLEQIEGGQEVNEIFMQAENQARAKEFQQARQTLTRAIEQGASGERFEQVQQTLEELEKAWEEKIIGPIKECMRKHEHQEAYTLCRQALSQVASPDLRKRLENLQTDTVSIWAQKSLSDLRLALHQDPAPDRPALEEIVAQLDRLAALGPVENLRKEIDNLSKAANTKRLELMLDDAKQDARRLAWDSAFEKLDAIRTEANRLDMGRIVEQAVNLSVTLETERHELEIGQRRQQHEQLIAEAQRLWEEVGKRSDLQQVGKLASQSLGIPGFEQDREALAWQQRAEQAIESFDRTKEAIQKSRDRIRNREFADAESVLGIASISPLLQEEHEQQISLAHILQQAEEDQIGGNWQSALKGYQQAVDMEGGLSSLLKEDQDICRKKIMDQVLLRAQQSLEAIPPRPDEARDDLDRAKAEGWIVAAYQTKVDRLLRWCQSQEHVARAAEILKLEGQDPTQALEALREARRQLPAGQDEAAILHWEALAEALAAWPHDLDEVETRLQEIEATSLNTLGRVQRLSRDLAQKREEEAIHQEEQRRRDRLLAEARRQIERALADSPLRCEDAVATARQAVQQLGEGPPTADLGRIVQVRMEELLNSARGDDDYDEAIRQARLLRKLAPKEEKWRSLPEELVAERRLRLEQALQDARVAVEAYELDSARRSLQLADQVAQPAGDPLLDSIRQELETRQDLVEQVVLLLEKAKEAAHKGRWPEAEEQLQEARQKAPDYAGVVEAIQIVQGQLLTASNAALEAEEFSKALDLGSLGLGLGRHPEIEALQKTTIARRDARKEALRKQIQEALDTWDLGVAGTELDKAEKLAPDDGSFRYLRTQTRQMETGGGELKRWMKAGWSALHSRDYVEAQRAFGQALEAVPSFREAQLWRDYTASLEQAVRLCRNGQWEAFSEVPRLLQEAEARVYINPGGKLPALLPNLADERKQAVWNVRQLQPLADELVDLYRQYEAHFEQVEVHLAQGLMSRIDEQCQAFLRRHDSPTTPYTDFEANCMPAEAGAGRTQARTRSKLDRTEPGPQPPARPASQQEDKQSDNDVEPPPVKRQDRISPPESEAGEQTRGDFQDRVADSDKADRPQRAPAKPSMRPEAKESKRRDGQPIESHADESPPGQPSKGGDATDEDKSTARPAGRPAPPRPAYKPTPPPPVEDEPDSAPQPELDDGQAEEEEDLQNWDFEWDTGGPLPSYEEE